MDSDGEIARAARLKPINEIGAKLGVPADALIPYGHTKAKISARFLKSLADKPDGDLVLVTAMNPTPAGEGKTTTTVGKACPACSRPCCTKCCQQPTTAGPWHLVCCMGLMNASSTTPATT